MKKLSICIPVYNRAKIFAKTLRNTCENCTRHSNEIEIVISDNNSSENLVVIVEEIKGDFPNLEIFYEKLDTNIGMANNFFEVVEKSRSEFCWIIGSDDFIKTDAIETILRVLNDYPDLDFINVNYDLTDLNDKLENMIFKDIQKYLSDQSNITLHIAPTSSNKLVFDDLIDPEFNNVFLGAMMTNIFRKSCWDLTAVEILPYNEFNTLISVYPHCYKFAKTFLGCNAYYIGNPMITVGEGKREWTTETGLDYWSAPISYIHFTIISEMIDFYFYNGLKKSQYYKCKKYYSRFVGDMLYDAIIQKYITKINKNIYLNLDIKGNLKRYWMFKDFYKYFLKSLLRSFKPVE